MIALVLAAALATAKPEPPIPWCQAKPQRTCRVGAVIITAVRTLPDCKLPVGIITQDGANPTEDTGDWLAHSDAQTVCLVGASSLHVNSYWLKAKDGKLTGAAQ